MAYFSKVLIANRGEIAVRVARTCRELGIRTVAVFSDADQSAPHVQACDEAVHIGPAASAESYLVADKIIAAAKQTGAQAIHPGYGFLSENAGFADALEKVGLVFIGPTAKTIRAMGSKSAAKDLMEAAGVPTTPGYQGENQSLDTFKAEAKRIGYPVLLKATAGGGGKGMRLVEAEKDMKAALASAKQEAKSAFGDDRFLIEKYIARARHLEVQIFGDGEGEVVHLYERDCSVQRRHQKIIEEAPAPNLPDKVRRKLLEAGVNAGKAVDYRGAGTVEFLYDGEDGVFFMEMNTRLQVEHPVTEMITGQDLVAWQLAVAAGEGLPLKQDDIAASGHAFEARLYAENPNAEFSPSIGTLQTLRLPEGLARIDSGVEQAQVISPFYDPMIAKIITHGPSRSAALGKLDAALAETIVTGLETNTAFLKRLCHDPDFANGDVSTRYIEEHDAALFAAPDMTDFAACAYSLICARDADVSHQGLRLNARPQQLHWGVIDDKTCLFRLSKDGEGWTLNRSLNATAQDRRAGETEVELPALRFTGDIGVDGRVTIVQDGLRQSGWILPHLDGYRVFLAGEHVDIALIDPLSPSVSDGGGAGSLNAAMPGVILNVYVEMGDKVTAGTDLISMEAMKMEHTITAPFDGTVTAIRFAPGDQVKDGDVLIGLEADDA